MKIFGDIKVSDSLLDYFAKKGIQTPTPIQEQAIPLALEGKDILGSAQTGTGKTLAYLVPLIEKLMNDQNAHALIITPTRELAQQVSVIVQEVLQHNKFCTYALLVGGESIVKQLHQLRLKPRIIIGTPGRLADHLERGSLQVKATKFFVLDEADRMLDMGFKDQIDTIVDHLPKERQTLMFSATLPHHIMAIAGEYLVQPARVSVSNNTIPLDTLKQEVIHVQQSDKFEHLLNQLNERSGSVIIFVKTKMDAQRLAKQLTQNDHEASAMHGDLRHNKRVQVINAFKKGKYRIMVATDIASRGLDIPHIMHVVNYDLPQCPEDFIHRLGRTARAGATGCALSLLSPRDASKWRLINTILKKQTGSDTGISAGPAPMPRTSYRKNDGPKKFFDRPRTQSYGKRRFDKFDDAAKPAWSRDEKSDYPTSGFARKRRFGQESSDTYKPRSERAPRTGGDYDNQAFVSDDQREEKNTKFRFARSKPKTYRSFGDSKGSGNFRSNRSKNFKEGFVKNNR